VTDNRVMKDAEAGGSWAALLRAMQPPALPGDMFSLAAMLVCGLDHNIARRGLRQGDNPILLVREIGTVTERASPPAKPGALQQSARGGSGRIPL